MTVSTFAIVSLPAVRVEQTELIEKWEKPLPSGSRSSIVPTYSLFKSFWVFLLYSAEVSYSQLLQFLPLPFHFIQRSAVEQFPLAGSTIIALNTSEEAQGSLQQPPCLPKHHPNIILQFQAVSSALSAYSSFSLNCTPEASQLYERGNLLSHIRPTA